MTEADRRTLALACQTYVGPVNTQLLAFCELALGRALTAEEETYIVEHLLSAVDASRIRRLLIRIVS